ncbi:helix-turn-helix domain-containing protein [Leifsonia poae]|uniref:helix-turn-helix domain-containing protein n=1 Tax=Leifsonia poae TaxID=110933 RepID=UPI001CBD65E7|nr:AraC family transcriptional regulator [Leifsonia poae]
MTAEHHIGRTAVREVIPRDPESSFRWRTHGFPDPLARWNHHPEIELHLLRRGSGRYVIGDAVGSFSTGAFFLVGSNAPHDWVSDLTPGESFDDRDVVLQFHPAWLEGLRAVAPELHELDALLERSARAVEFLGETAFRAAEMLLDIGGRTGTDRVVGLLDLLGVLARAPGGDWRSLSSHAVAAGSESERSDIVASAVDYIFEHLHDGPRLAVAARMAGMSESSFSRRFAAATGQTFSDLVRRLRLTHACRLLEEEGRSISSIAYEAGYANLSNFNRRFRDEYSMTPREFRRILLRSRAGREVS